jgi:hypothetical protein
MGQVLAKCRKSNLHTWWPIIALEDTMAVTTDEDTEEELYTNGWCVVYIAAALGYLKY